MEEYFGRESIADCGNGIRVTVTWPEDEWVYGLILSYGPAVTILEPAHIRSIIEQRAEKIANKYRKPI